MSLHVLVLRNLAWFWRTNVLVLLGAAIAVSVLAGALLVGTSVRASLRRLALERLGATDVVVTGTTFVREALADDLRRAGSEIRAAVPLIAVDGVVSHAPSGRRAGPVHVFGVDDRFWRFHAVAGVSGPAARDAFLSPALAEELGASTGDGLVVRVQRPSAVPSGVLQGRRDDTSLALRVSVRAVLPAERLGEFSLALTQAAVRAVFVPLSRVQRDLDQLGRVNTVLVADFGQATSGEAQAAAVTAALGTAVQAEDLGLKAIAGADRPALVVESEAGLIPERLQSAIEQEADRLGYRTLPVLAYLANTIRVGNREIPYSVVAAVDVRRYQQLSQQGDTAPATPASGPRVDPIAVATSGARSGTDAPAAIAEGEPLPGIWLNEWAARELAAAAGSKATLEYFLWSDERGLETRSAAFVVAGVVPMDGAGGDRTLTPEYPGLTDAPRIGEWDPPFPVDLERVRPADEAYWDRFRAAPKALVALDAGQRLWGSSFGRVTSVRVYPPGSSSLDDARSALLERLRSSWTPAAAGVSAHPVRARALAAARGSTDFAEYFLYFSFFLAMAGLLLMGLFFRLGVEQRAREVGLLRSIGFSTGTIGRLLLLEGTTLAVLGSLLGAGGAIGFSALILLGLRTWWIDAVGTRALTVQVEPFPMFIGGLGGVLMAVVTIWWTLRVHASRTARALMSGAPAETLAPRARARTWPSALIWWLRAPLPAWLLVAALVLLVLGWQAVVSNTTAFFGGGVLLLATMLTVFARWLRRPPATAIHEPGAWGLARLGARQTSWRPGRSVLSVALIASATFLIVAVGAFRREAGGGAGGPDSSTGGFALWAESLVPLMHDVGSPAGRSALGFSSDDEAIASGLRVSRFRLRPGDEGSCLNLYRPASPRIVAPTDAFRREARFTFASTLAATDAERANPWLLLDRRFEDGAVPVIGDANSLTYSLHRGVGDEFLIGGPGATPVTVRVVAALADSVFKSELLMADRDFVRVFPRHEGSRFFLIDAPADRRARVAALLEDRLADFGFDVQSARERLAAYHRVENTYLTTFQTLGGLGLVLGTFGLGAVLLRNVLERRRELAVLRAVGYRGRHLATMVLAESLLLLAAGLGTGLLAAVLAILPALLARGGPLPISSTVALLGSVLAAGLVSSLAATRAAAAAPLLPALRSE